MTYVSENFWHDAVNKATTDLFTFGYKHIIKPHFDVQSDGPMWRTTDDSVLQDHQEHSAADVGVP